QRAYVELCKIMEGCLPDFPALILSRNQFPETPWQDLDQEFRAKVVQELHKGFRHRYKASRLDAVNILTRWELQKIRQGSLRARYAHSVFIQEDLRQTEVGEIAINFNYLNGEITKAFANWLSRSE